MRNGSDLRCQYMQTTEHPLMLSIQQLQKQSNRSSKSTVCRVSHSTISNESKKTQRTYILRIHHRRDKNVDGIKFRVWLSIARQQSPNFSHSIFFRLRFIIVGFWRFKNGGKRIFEKSYGKRQFLEKLPQAFAWQTTNKIFDFSCIKTIVIKSNDIESKYFKFVWKRATNQM